MPSTNGRVFNPRKPQTNIREHLFFFVLIGGAEGDRTLDLQIANLSLSQLSYSPMYNLFVYNNISLTLQRQVPCRFLKAKAFFGHLFCNLATVAAASLARKQNFAACGKKCHLGHFLSSRPTELQPQSYFLQKQKPYISKNLNNQEKSCLKVFVGLYLFLWNLMLKN